MTRQQRRPFRFPLHVGYFYLSLLILYICTVALVSYHTRQGPTQ